MRVLQILRQGTFRLIERDIDEDRIINTEKVDNYHGVPTLKLYFKDKSYIHIYGIISEQYDTESIAKVLNET
jgi:hypothetical protein